jgi:opacity protein-like surface antigen
MTVLPMGAPNQSTPLRALVLACVLAVGASVSAAAQPTVSVRGNVGASFFRSPETLSEALHSGIDLGIGAGVRVYRGLSITVKGGYDQFTLNEETARLFQRIEVGDLSFLSGSVGLRYTYLNDSDAHPYASAGVGVYRVGISNRKVFERGEIVERQPQRTATEMGVHLALGALFRLDDTYAVFFEPRYVFYDVGESVTGTLRFFTLRLGVDVQVN